MTICSHQRPIQPVHVCYVPRVIRLSAAPKLKYHLTMLIGALTPLSSFISACGAMIHSRDARRSERRLMSRAFCPPQCPLDQLSTSSSVLPRRLEGCGAGSHTQRAASVLPTGRDDDGQVGGELCTPPHCNYTNTVVVSSLYETPMLSHTLPRRVKHTRATSDRRRVASVTRANNGQVSGRHPPNVLQTMPRGCTELVLWYRGRSISC